MNAQPHSRASGSGRESMGRIGNLRLWLVSAVFFFLIGVQDLLGNPFHDPMIPDGEVLVYKFHGQSFDNAFLSDIKRGEEVDSIRFATNIDHDASGQKMYRITEDGQRRNGFRVAHIFELLVEDGDLKPLSVSGTDFNKSGRAIRSTTAFFDDPSVVYPEETFPVVLAHHALRGSEFRRGNSFSFLALIQPMVIVRLFVRVGDVEEVEVPAGRMKCHRVELKPDISTMMSLPSFLTKLLQPFMPRYHIWYSVEASHPLVKFEGNLGGTGAGEQVWELKEIGERTRRTDSISSPG